MYERCLDLLNSHGVEFEKGLTNDEVTKIEQIYEIKFPNSLKEFLMVSLPVSKGFYNWRNTKDDNVQFIRRIINEPVRYIDNMAEEIYWCDKWGKEPEDKKSIGNEVRKRLKKAPKLLPIYAHRYIPMILDENPPIISVHGIDVIYYGKCLDDYFNIEFGNKEQNSIDFFNLVHIPFWSDII